MSKKVKHYENVYIENFAAEGKSIARIEDKVIFVNGAVAGDWVDIEIVHQKKNYAEANVSRIRKPSELRTEPFCSHFGLCGGCKWQHLDYESQLKFKQQQVIDALERIGKIKLPECPPILASPKSKYYRNKLDFTFSDKRWLTSAEIASEETIERRAIGFHIPKRFDKIIDVDHCYLQPDPSNSIRLALKNLAIENDYSFFNLLEQTGLLRGLMIRNTTIGELMVVVQFREADQVAIDKIMNFLKTNFPQITSLQYVINQKRNEDLSDQHFYVFDGKPYIIEQMENLQFRIGAKSFFQTNSEQAYHLYSVARDFAQLSGNEVVYDLYTGTGTIANFVAARAKQVIGIEYVAVAIEDAKINSEINQIRNTEFWAGDMKDILNESFTAQYAKPDVIITDPPRAGMHQDVVNQLLRIEASRIIYVSCNPATQARDVNWLSTKYEVKKIQPVDMFPHTYHVENVLLMELK